ncbi:S-adenosyl-L-methionine-dependent methyltransferase [Podospora appendiculata]|uniref:DNA (cytosine-5-)-methyltransferase n=1 Tax=Podospora appendiculata TaxID=314037 RepID=A0AAE0XIA9_9PEZI|nr:S-adenosyl-L-methionine-dependent methyltransferase [Podospora appendiculata]
MADPWFPDALGAEQNPFVIDDQDDDHDDIDRQLRAIERRGLIDLTGDSSHQHIPHHHYKQHRPNKALRRVKREDGLVLEVGMVVEIDKIPDRHVRFFKINSIAWDPARNEHLLRGWGFARCRDLSGILPRKLNECAMIVQFDNLDPRPWLEQALISIKLESVRRVRVLVVTNAPFPKHRFETRDLVRKGKDWIEKRGPLVCRYRYMVYFNQRPRNPLPCEWALVRMAQDDADPGFQEADHLQLNQWRGCKVRGGSYIPNGIERPVLDLEADDDPLHAQLVRRLPGQRYSAGDAFAGAGGASRGMEMAGLRLVFAIDHWHHAVASLRSNFPHTDVHERDVADFVTDESHNYRVDFLHLSPPCQVWSPAHTRPGRNDEDNIAALFSCTHLIEKVRPRLFTVEQTFGMLHRQFKPYFNTLVQGFTAHGYSVRWKVVHLATFGLPQPRRRLIMIGAGPGEKLPPFPEPTHSKDHHLSHGLKPLVSAQQALAPIARLPGSILHQPANQVFDEPRAPWDPENPLRFTITTGGTVNYYWDGKRDFTLLEYAILQGFPAHHKFKGKCIKKQIGNAFPSSVVKVLYKHLTAWLDEQDGVVAAKAVEVDEDIASLTSRPPRRHHSSARGVSKKPPRHATNSLRISGKVTKPFKDVLKPRSGLSKIHSKVLSPGRQKSFRAKYFSIEDKDEEMIARVENMMVDDDDDFRSDTATLRGSMEPSPWRSSRASSATAMENSPFRDSIIDLTEKGTKYKPVEILD